MEIGPLSSGFDRMIVSLIECANDRKGDVALERDEDSEYIDLEEPRGSNAYLGEWGGLDIPFGYRLRGMRRAPS